MDNGRNVVKIKTIYGEEFFAIERGQTKDNIITNNGYIPKDEIEEYAVLGTWGGEF